MTQHIENAAFQHWRLVHGLYANNTVISGVTKQENDKGKELALAAFSGTCNRCGHQDHKEADLTEFRQPLQVQSHLEMPRILVQLGHIQRT